MQLLVCFFFPTTEAEHEVSNRFESRVLRAEPAHGIGPFFSRERKPINFGKKINCFRIIVVEIDVALARQGPTTVILSLMRCFLVHTSVFAH